MTDPRYARIGDVIHRAAEECAELIGYLMKAERFGIDNTCPPEGGKPSEVGKTNRELIRAECKDVIERATELLVWLEQ